MGMNQMNMGAQMNMGGMGMGMGMGMGGMGMGGMGGWNGYWFVLIWSYYH